MNEWSDRASADVEGTISKKMSRKLMRNNNFRRESATASDTRRDNRNVRSRNHIIERLRQRHRQAAITLGDDRDKACEDHIPLSRKANLGGTRAVSVMKSPSCCELQSRQKQPKLHSLLSSKDFLNKVKENILPKASLEGPHSSVPSQVIDTGMSKREGGEPSLFRPNLNSDIQNREHSPACFTTELSDSQGTCENNSGGMLSSENLSGK